MKLSYFFELWKELVILGAFHFHSSDIGMRCLVCLFYWRDVNYKLVMHIQHLEIMYMTTWKMDPCINPADDCICMLKMHITELIFSVIIMSCMYLNISHCCAQPAHKRLYSNCPLYNFKSPTFSFLSHILSFFLCILTLKTQFSNRDSLLLYVLNSFWT